MGEQYKPEEGEQLKEPVETGDFKKRLADLEAERQKDIQKRVFNMESLIGEGKNTSRLLSEAKDLLAEFPKDQEEEYGAQRKEVQDLITSLENQQREIEGKIKKIYADQSVEGKIREAAGKEDVERKRKQEIKEKEEEFLEKIDRIIEEVKNLFLRRAKLDSDEWWKGKVRPLIDDNYQDILDLLKKSESEGDFGRQLSGVEKNLGVFSFKKKLAIGKIKEKLVDLVKSYYQETEDIKNKDSSLTTDSQNIMAEARKLSEESKLAQDVDLNCHVRLRRGIEKLAEEMPQYKHELGNFINYASRVSR